jgi:FtsH-binding integral membrane protein
VLYNLFLFFASRQYTYLFFSLFLAASGVLIYVGSGVSTILGLLVPSSLPLAYLCLGMVLVFGALFSISLLNIKSTNKTLSNTWFTVLLLNVAATSIIVYIAERENFPLPR